MNVIENISKDVMDAVDTVTVPMADPGAYLDGAMGSDAQGLSAMRTTAEAITALPEAGIPTGPNPDGSESVTNAFIRVFCEAVVDHIHDRARVECYGAPMEMRVRCTSQGAGGTSVFEATNTDIIKIKGIIL